MKESWEPSTKLEFDGFDDMVTDGGQPGGKGTNQPPQEEVSEDGKGEEVMEDGESESKPRKESNFGSLLVAPGCYSLRLETARRAFFL